MFDLAYGYARNNMSAFVELQQKEFAAAERGFTAVKHQREVGTGYFDDVTQVIQAGKSSTTALHGSTEDEQFFEAADADPQGHGKRPRGLRRQRMKRDNFPIPGIQIPPHQPNLYDRILTPQAIGFVAHLHRKYEQRRRDLMKARAERQARLDAGETFAFLPETRSIRESEWKVGPVPDDLQDRRVEITGPVERKMVINALNSGASHVHGGLRGLVHALVGQHDPRPDQPAPGGRPHHQLHQPRGQELQAERQDRDAHRAPARLAPARAPRADRRRPGVGRRSSTSASSSSTTPSAWSSRARAPTSTCPRSRATSRRACGTTCSTRPRRG